MFGIMKLVKGHLELFLLLFFVVFCITGIMNRTRSALGGHMLRFVSLLLLREKKKKGVEIKRIINPSFHWRAVVV